MNADLATLTYEESAASGDNIIITASDSRTGADPNQLRIAVTAPLDFTHDRDDLIGGPGGNLFVATNDTIGRHDIAIGGPGINTLALEGKGTFDLAKPKTLENIQIVTAQEGQGKFHHGKVKIASQVQTVILRDGMDGVTVNVAPAVLNPQNPLPSTITIIGADNNDVINLASGNDVVILGSAAETVHGGSGDDTSFVDANTIGATIDGGTSGKSQIQVTGGGTLVMGPSITDVSLVELDPSKHAYNFAANAIAGLTVEDLSHGHDTLTAGAAGQTLEGGANGKETFVGFGSGETLYRDTADQFDGDTIENFSAGDGIDVRNLKFDSKTQVSFMASSATQGVLTISENGKTQAQIALFGQLSAASFTVQSDGAGGALILDPPSTHPNPPSVTDQTNHHHH